MIFYTYLWLRDNGFPRYAGKGSGRRAFRKGCPSNSQDILIQPFFAEEDAFFAEQILIAFYGRLDIQTGCLCNKTDGGEGFSGGRHTQRSRQQISEYGKMRVVSEETCRKISLSKTGIKQPKI